MEVLAPRIGGIAGAIFEFDLAGFAMNLAGLPATTVSAATSRLTELWAPTRAPLPTVTPGSKIDMVAMAA